jgi:alpha-beta hydrolase superfamily lysophospholipase
MLNHPLVTRDGLALHLQFWSADPRTTPKGVVLVVHGLGEHIERYDGLAFALREQGWWVVGYDQRGHGRSPGARGGLVQRDDLLADLGMVVKRLRALAPQLPGPLVLLGHSMGGVVASRYVAEGLAASPAAWYRPVDGLVLSSPALALDISILQRLLLAVAEPLLPGLAVHNGLKPQWISQDPAVVQAYEADLLVHNRITPRLARFILEGGAWVRRHAAQWQLPTLLLYAGSDRCVASRGSAEFSRRAPAQALRSHSYPELFHEIFNEPQRDAVIADLLLWLDEAQTRRGGRRSSKKAASTR